MAGKQSLSKLFAPGQAANAAAHQFRKGGLYQFKSLRAWREKSGAPYSNSRITSVRYVYLSPEQGNGMTLHIFQSVTGKWRESFTPAQLGDYDVMEAR
jgi:hypothetical protein